LVEVGNQKLLFDAGRGVPIRLRQLNSSGFRPGVRAQQPRLGGASYLSEQSYSQIGAAAKPGGVIAGDVWIGSAGNLQKLTMGRTP
jgi:hypothetical protein